MGKNSAVRPLTSALGRREREIMECVYRLGSATVAQVRAELAHPPTYSAVRGMLRFLEAKGHLRHHAEGLKFVYAPTVSPKRERLSALRNLVRTFFAGSISDATAALLELPEAEMPEEEMARLRRLVAGARRHGQPPPRPPRAGGA